MNNRRREYGASGYEVKKYVIINNALNGYSVGYLKDLVFIHSDDVNTQYSLIGTGKIENYDAIITELGYSSTYYTKYSILSVLKISNSTIRLYGKYGYNEYESFVIDVDLSTMTGKVVNRTNNGYLINLVLASIGDTHLAVKYCWDNICEPAFWLLSGKDEVKTSSNYTFKQGQINASMNLEAVSSDTHFYILDGVYLYTLNQYYYYDLYIRKMDINGNIVKSVLCLADRNYDSSSYAIKIIYNTHNDELILHNNGNITIYDKDLNILKTSSIPTNISDPSNSGYYISVTNRNPIILDEYPDELYYHGYCYGNSNNSYEFRFNPHTGSYNLWWQYTLSSGTNISYLDSGLWNNFNHARLISGLDYRGIRYLDGNVLITLEGGYDCPLMVKKDTNYHVFTSVDGNKPNGNSAFIKMHD
jgi:hypothetical protein